MTLGYWLIVAAGLLAVVYGIVTAVSVMNADAGTDRMKQIAAAVQEGAGAYLNRQYRTIALAGIVILIILGVTLGPRARPRARGPRRGHHGHAGGGARAARSVGLLRLPAVGVYRSRRAADPGSAGGALLRRVADLDFRAARRRHLHQGRRRRCGPRGQGRGRHPRG